VITLYQNHNVNRLLISYLMVEFGRAENLSDVPENYEI